MTAVDTRSGVDQESDVQVPQEVLDLLIELGVRYDVIDGSVVVMPSATFRHERDSAGVLAQLYAQCPEGIEVLGPNYNFYYKPPTSSFVCGDVLVARTEDCGEHGIDVPPLLMVEALSRSSCRHDLLVKRDIYAEAGVPSYWLIDPVAKTLTVMELTDGEYVETQQVIGNEPLTVERPFPAEIRLKR